MNNYDYYTPVDLATALLNFIPNGVPVNSIVDICCGSWNLLSAAQKRFPAAKITGVDINPNAKSFCLDGATFICSDGRIFANQKKQVKKTYDIIFSNPPFGYLSKSQKKYNSKQNILTKSKRYEIELLWANLKLMHDNSVLIIILPSTYLDGTSYIEYRKWIATKYSVQTIIRLPIDTFEKSSLNTIAIVLQKKQIRRSYEDIHVYQASYDLTWKFIPNYIITKKSAESGIWDNVVRNRNIDCDIDIFRGNISSKFFAEKGEDVLHCSSLFIDMSWEPRVRCCSNIEEPQKKYIESGDIIINRIGRCAGYWTIYTGSPKLISDCLIAIKRPSDTTMEILKNSSKNGKLKLPLRGVSTPYVTIGDIKNLIINGR